MSYVARAGSARGRELAKLESSVKQISAVLALYKVQTLTNQDINLILLVEACNNGKCAKKVRNKIY